MSIIVNPATGEVISEIADANAQQVDKVVAAAKSAFPAWRAVSPQDRARLLRTMGNVVEERSMELAELESQNVGKPISSARAEMKMVAEAFFFYSGAVDKHHGETIPVAGGVDMTFREPLGVVGLITPWNFPAVIASWKLAPALACGNAVVLKPSELTPLTSLRLAELALEAGFPEGVVTVVTGPGETTGRSLVDHPEVSKIGFTGSTEVGREIMRRAATSIKRITLELGGKSANIIFADAEVEEAAAAAPYSVFDNAGQDCCARSRILVETSIFDEFLDLLIKAIDRLRVGDPSDEVTEMGPLISQEQREKVQSYVVDDRVVYRGFAPHNGGYWFPPTVMAPMSNNDRSSREEIFGPIVSVIPFEGEEEGVAIANDTSYGLSSSVWTNNGARALRVCRRLETGVVSVNSNTSVRVSTPFGGFKQSGLGRELGMQALDSYSEIKNVFFAV